MRKVVFLRTSVQQIAYYLAHKEVGHVLGLKELWMERTHLIGCLHPA